jgi:RHS repeat-associated protein
VPFPFVPGQVTEVVQGDGRKVQYTYDDANRLSQITYADGDTPPDKVMTYSYNNANQLIAEDSKATGKITYSYDANGNLIKKSGKKLAQTYEYTVANRIKAVKNEGILLLAVTYDGDGNRIFQISLKNSNAPVDVGKCGDENGKGNNGKHNGADNGNGNKNQGDNGNHYGNNKGCDQGKGNNGNHNGNDKGNNGNHNGSDNGNNGNDNGNSGNSNGGGNGNNGNAGVGNGNSSGGDNSNGNRKDKLSLASTQSKAMSSSDKQEKGNDNQSTSSQPSDPSSSAPSDDPSMVFPDNDTSNIDKNYYDITYYVNDVNRQYTQQLMTYDDEGNLKDAYVYGNNDERLTRDHIQNDNPTELGHRALDTYLYDGRGGVSQVTNEQSNIVGNQQYRYDPFGNMIQNKPDNEIMFGYNGEEYNPITDTQYLRARYYDVGMSIFISKDTYLGDTQNPLTQNLYAYT